MSDDDSDKISVTHLNLRPSISILTIQLVFLDLLAAITIICGYLGILQYQDTINLILKSLTGLVILVIIFTVQIFLTIYAVLQWNNEIYELTRNILVHKKGIFFRKIQKYSMADVRYASINQGVLGQILNFGTISLYNVRKEKFLDLNLIHNPTKYLEIFEKIDPDINVTKEVLREEVFNRPE